MCICCADSNLKVPRSLLPGREVFILFSSKKTALEGEITKQEAARELLMNAGTMDRFPEIWVPGNPMAAGAVITITEWRNTYHLPQKKRPSSICQADTIPPGTECL